MRSTHLWDHRFHEHRNMSAYSYGQMILQDRLPKHHIKRYGYKLINCHEGPNKCVTGLCDNYLVFISDAGYLNGV